MDDKELVKYITIKQASSMLGVTTLTLRNWDKKKKLVAYRHPINNYRVYKQNEIENFLNRIENHNKPRKISIQILDDSIAESNDILEI